MPDDDFFWERLKGIWTDEWRRYAACADVDSSVFEDPDNVDLAKGHCQGCSVRLECLDDALYYKDEDMVRGGLSPAEQQVLIRHRARYAHYMKHDVQELLELL